MRIGRKRCLGIVPGVVLALTFSLSGFPVGMLTAQAAGPFGNIGFTYSTSRIMKTDPLPAAQSWALYLAKNEREGVQFSYKELDLATRDVKVELSAFTDSSGHTLPAELFSMRYIKALTQADGGTGADGVYGDGKYYADALVPVVAGETFAAEQGVNLQFYVEARSTADTVAGAYQAAVQLFDAADNTPLAEGTITATVWNFALPAKPAVDVLIPLGWAQGWVLPQLFGLNGIDPDNPNDQDARFALYNGYFEFMIDHGISPGVLPTALLSDGLLDAKTDAYLNDPRLTTFYFPYALAGKCL